MDEVTLPISTPIKTISREERFARKMTGTSGVGASPTMAHLLLEIDEAMEEIRRMRDAGASAKEMASSLKYVSVLTLLENLSGEDRRLANDAAKELLKVGVDEGPKTVINVLNVDHNNKEAMGDLARRLAFLDQLRANKRLDGVVDRGMVPDADIEPDIGMVIGGDNVGTEGDMSE